MLREICFGDSREAEALQPVLISPVAEAVRHFYERMPPLRDRFMLRKSYLHRMINEEL